MNLRRIRTGFLFCLMLLAFGCGKDRVEDITGDGAEESCAVSFRLKADQSMDVVALTRSGSVPTEDDFMVRIENTRGEVLKSWKYAEVPSLIKVVPGSYKLVGWYGADTLLPAFEAPYYYGEAKFKLTNGANLDTIVKCSMAAVKVTVDFDESFQYEYDEFSVDVKTVGDSLRFAKDEKRAGYFKPGKIRLRFELRPIGSQSTYEYYSAVAGNVKAKEFYKMKLKANTDKGALKSVTITTDSSTIDVPVNVELPGFYLPKPAPKLNPKGFVSGEALETTEGLSQGATVLVASAAGLTELKVKTVSEELLAKGWSGEIDLMNLSVEEAAFLKANGLEWSDELNTQDEIKTTVWVRFDNVIKALNTTPNQTTSSMFEVVGTDRFGQDSEGECKLVVNVAPPVFGFQGGSPVPGNLFAKRAIFDLVYSANRDGYSPTLEYKTPGGEWQAAEITGSEKGMRRALVQGLSSNSDYVFRAVLGGHMTEEFQLKTEEELQVPNAGFEDWYEEKVWEKTPMGGQKIYAYYPYVSGSTDTWWNTRNRTTTQPLADYSWFYAAYSGTVPTSKTDRNATFHLNTYAKKGLPTGAHSGNSAMEISTVGWGKNNWTSQSSAQSGCKTRTAGALYIGSYDLSSHSETYGHAFDSRPTSVQFYYRFYSYEGESAKAYAEFKDADGNVVGYGMLRISEATNDYRLGEIVVDYTRLEKAVSMTIVFLSTDAESPATLAIQGDKGLLSGYGDGRHIGSVLTVDDVLLVY